MPYVPISRAAVAFAALVIVVVTAALAYEEYDAEMRLWTHAAATTGGNPHRGEAMFIQYGCGSCHHIGYVRKATGLVGPPLDNIALRAMIAGKLSNTPANVEQWIRNPQSVTPGTDMPNLNVSERDARDITAFLYTRTSVK
jgi:cytochrome c2